MADVSPAWIGPPVRAHVRSIRFRVWMIALILAAGAMAYMPLFNLLGFGFCFVLAILASLACLDLGSALTRRLARDPQVPATSDGPGAPWRALRLFASTALVHLGLLIGPLLVICANSLRVRNCDWTFGVQAFLLLPVLSSIGATWCGMLLGLCAGRRRVLGNALPYLFFLSAVGYAIWRFYSAPPVFSYNLFGGYFPGNLYDEEIAFRAPFYWARLWQFSVLLTLVGLASLLVRDGRLPGLRSWPRALVPGSRSRLLVGVTTTACAVAGLWLHSQSGRLGFDIDARDIQRFLGGRYDTEHFIIYYPTGGAIEREIHWIADDHEFRYAQAARTLGAEAERRITSYYFENAYDKYVMMGAGRVNMAKPWRSEIYLHHRGFPHGVIRHEVAHVIAGAFGSPVFRVSADSWLGLPVVFNVGLIEGTAVAADWPGRPDRTLTPHESVKAMIEMGMAPPVERILSTGFLAFSSARSYTMAGSLVRYLLDTEGPAKVRELYRTGGDFQAVYGRSQAEVLADWRAMIDAIQLPVEAVEIVRERFRRPSIFARPCPHAIARLRALRSEKLAAGDIAGAVAVAERIVAQVPGEPRYQMTLADTLVMAGDEARATGLYRGIRDNAEQMSSSLRAEATVELASMAARAGDWPQVRALLAEADTWPLGEGQARYVDALRFATDHRGPAGAHLLDYFWRHDPRWATDPVAQMARTAAMVTAEPDLGLGYYLLGRNLSNRGVHAEVMPWLARALDLGLPSPLLQREAARILARVAYRGGRLDQVERAAHILMHPDNPSITQLSAIDWLERVYWKRHGQLPSQPDLAHGG